MLIKGFQKLTLLDYPERTACTIFTAGCNLRCPFCHNSLLVTDIDDEYFSEEEIFEHLRKRKNVLDGVAVSGGEPLLQADIESFLYELKCMDYDVKLDTNGCYPEKLSGILELGLVDYVAMDIKNCPQRYAQAVGMKDFDITPVRESIELLKNGSVDYEFRTTVVDGLHTVDSIEAAAEWIQGAPKYFLQNFVDSGMLIDNTCKGVGIETMKEMLAAARRFVPNTQLRGI